MFMIMILIESIVILRLFVSRVKHKPLPLLRQRSIGD
jgi:hypothetical protein